MVVVDTSVWIDYFNKSDPLLQLGLNEYDVATHPFILGELACGNLKNRKNILEPLSNLPSIGTISMEEYFMFVEKNKLYGSGLGFVDIHLLASCLIVDAPLYTKDKKLLSRAKSFGITYR